MCEIGGNGLVKGDVKQISKARKPASIVSLAAATTTTLTVRQLDKLESGHALDANSEREIQH